MSAYQVSTTTDEVVTIDGQEYGYLVHHFTTAHPEGSLNPTLAYRLKGTPA